MKRIVLIIIVLLVAINSFLEARQPRMMNSAELQIALKKLTTLGSVLYVAAHPDDENTAVLAYLSSQRLMRAGYLSLTRGGGGQNRIGSEKGPLMSVLRTNELLQARRIDTAEQFFTRAVDFGYSKTPQESIAIWGKEKILEDMVYVIRKFRPDVIMTRFSTQNGGHGHHLASTLLAVEAFDAAGDPQRFPEQLKHVTPWKPKRIYWNSWRPYLKGAKPEETAKLQRLDVGTYNTLLGKSYYEIASLSRSMHKSQGFGSIPRRGSWIDYFDLLKGEPATQDIMDGIDTTWNRVPGSAKVRAALEEANRLYDPREPHKVVPALLNALHHLEAMPGSYWTKQKKKELSECIRSAAGLWLEAIAARAEVTPGGELEVTMTAINRAGVPFKLKKLITPGENREIPIDKTLEENKRFTQKIKFKITGAQYTHPFWLRQKPEKGIYPAANHRYKGMAVAPYPFQLKFVLESGGRAVTLDAPVIFRWRDPVEGERIRDLNVTPPVTANFTEKVFYFTSRQPKTIGLILRSGPAPVEGKLVLKLPVGWKAEPAEIGFKIEKPLTEQNVSVTLTPPANDTVGNLQAVLQVGEKVYHHSYLKIEYPHLPVINLHPRAQARLVRVDAKTRARRVAYIMGSGDEIPTYLAQVGYSVDILSDDDLRNGDFKEYDTIITGVRAFNTREMVNHAHPRLMKYVEAGGRLVVQYNIARAFFSRDVGVKSVGPYPLKISRKRVTQEEALITLLQPRHPLLNSPNKILPGDFDDWVQERGLYFADEWDPQYTPLLAANDTGEEPQKGGLLVANYGKGTFVYTGYSFFRQLPAGVPGALKLFVNLIN